jgi:DNA-binding PadR family transcriptional regulator
MQKILFVFGEQCSSALISEAYYHFQPYHYGPYDSSINKDIELLEAEGFVDIVDTTAHRGRDYELTAIGEEKAQEILAELPVPLADYLAALVAWAQSLSFRDLVAAIYKEYPHMAANSVFR